MKNTTRLQIAAKKLNTFTDEINSIISRYEKAIKESNPGIPFFGSIFSRLERNDKSVPYETIRRIGWNKIKNNWCFVLAYENIDEQICLEVPHTNVSRITDCYPLLNASREIRIHVLDHLDNFISQYAEYIEDKVSELTCEFPKNEQKIFPVIRKKIDLNEYRI